jgi:hypothetical protein
VRLMRLRKLLFSLLLLPVATACSAGDKFDWKPFTPEELAMKDLQRRGKERGEHRDPICA